MLTEEDIHRFTELALGKARGVELPALYHVLERCGFDLHKYVATHPNARDDGFLPADGLLYFLAFGADEGDRVTAGPFPNGLAALFALDFDDLEYKNRIIDKIFAAQIAKSRVEQTLWTGKIDKVLAKLTEARAVPFFVIGDSHTSLYQRTVTYTDCWLAPLILQRRLRGWAVERRFPLAVREQTADMGADRHVARRDFRPADPFEVRTGRC